MQKLRTEKDMAGFFLFDHASSLYSFLVVYSIAAGSTLEGDGLHMQQALHLSSFSHKL